MSIKLKDARTSSIFPAGLKGTVWEKIYNAHFCTFESLGLLASKGDSNNLYNVIFWGYLLRYYDDTAYNPEDFGAFTPEIWRHIAHTLGAAFVTGYEGNRCLLRTLHAWMVMGRARTFYQNLLTQYSTGPRSDENFTAALATTNVGEYGLKAAVATLRAAEGTLITPETMSAAEGRVKAAFKALCPYASITVQWGELPSVYKTVAGATLPTSSSDICDVRSSLWCCYGSISGNMLQAVDSTADILPGKGVVYTNIGASGEEHSLAAAVPYKAQLPSGDWYIYRVAFPASSTVDTSSPMIIIDTDAVDSALSLRLAPYSTNPTLPAVRSLGSGLIQWATESVYWNAIKGHIVTIYTQPRVSGSEIFYEKPSDATQTTLGTGTRYNYYDYAGYTNNLSNTLSLRKYISEADMNSQNLFALAGNFAHAYFGEKELTLLRHVKKTVKYAYDYLPIGSGIQLFNDFNSFDFLLHGISAKRGETLYAVNTNGTVVTVCYYDGSAAPTANRHYYVGEYGSVGGWYDNAIALEAAGYTLTDTMYGDESGDPTVISAGTQVVLYDANGNRMPIGDGYLLAKALSSPDSADVTSSLSIVDIDGYVGVLASSSVNLKKCFIYPGQISEDSGHYGTMSDTGDTDIHYADIGDISGGVRISYTQSLSATPSGEVGTMSTQPAETTYTGTGTLGTYQSTTIDGATRYVWPSTVSGFNTTQVTSFSLFPDEISAGGTACAKVSSFADIPTTNGTYKYFAVKQGSDWIIYFGRGTALNNKKFSFDITVSNSEPLLLSDEPDPEVIINE